MKARLLVFGWGNPARGDDGLGPAFVGEAFRPQDVDFIVDYQLQPEHAFDLVGRRKVLFVDACADGVDVFDVRPVVPSSDPTLASHHLSPQALLSVYERVVGTPCPPAEVLLIRGWRFDLEESLSPSARLNLDAALTWWRSSEHCRA